MSRQSDNLIRLQTHPNGVGAAIRTSFRRGRGEIVTAGPNDEFAFIGSDPWDTNAYTGLVVPPTPTSANGDARYLFLLARASFGTGEQSANNMGARLVGIRQYVEIVARVPNTTPPTPPRAEGGPSGDVVFRKEITNPLWHPPDGDISWHVMVINRVQRDTRNPANIDGFIFQDAHSPALLYQAGAANGVGYVPPNDGVPWGKPLAASLGNIHDLRYPWRSTYAEWALDIPIPAPCDIVLFASVRQNDPTLNPTLAADTDCAVFTALSEEDRFMVAFDNFMQYGTIAGALVFEENFVEDVP